MNKLFSIILRSFVFIMSHQSYKIRLFLGGGLYLLLKITRNVTLKNIPDYPVFHQDQL